MDLFNRKRVKYLEDRLQELSRKEGNASQVIKFLVEEPDSSITKEIRKILYKKYKNCFWGSLTRECHLGWVFDKEYAKNEAKRLTKYL